MNRKKVLWISLCAPYDTVAHAGGKIHNMYLKNMHNSGYFDISLLSFCYEYEVPYLDLDKYQIKNQIKVISDHPVKKFIKKIYNIESVCNPFQKYAGIVPNYQKHYALKMARKYSEKNEQPDIVILHWTQMAVLYPRVVKWFPTSTFVMIEEDVSFLSYRRKADLSQNYFKKQFLKYRYKKLKNIELDVLSVADLTIVNNHKDEKLLLNNGLPLKKIFVSVPFFTDYSNVQWKPVTQNILFFGSMMRAENYKSVIWFIEKVFYKISDPNIKLIIVGGNPHPSLKKYQNSRIRMTGFVEDVSPFFADSMCFIAPLVMGAGIKIKVLEAFSAGIPVLTNEIGIEGIPAVRERDYLHCETPDDYLAAISSLSKGMIDAESLSVNSKKVIKDHFNFSERINHMIQRIYEC